jgi:DNA-binding MarR family transcriptional regulator
MNKTTDLSVFIGSHLFELGQIFHELFQINTSDRDSNKANAIRYAVLNHLSQAGEQSLTDMSSFVNYKKNTMSELVDRMVSDGLIERRLHNRDRRKIDITITSAGRDALLGFEEKFTSNIDTFTRRIGASSQLEFLEALATLVRISQSHFVKQKS